MDTPTPTPVIGITIVTTDPLTDVREVLDRLPEWWDVMVHPDVTVPTD